MISKTVVTPVERAIDTKSPARSAGLGPAPGRAPAPARARILSQDAYAIEARAQAALRQVVAYVESEAGSLQAEVLVRFVAACHDSERYPFELAALRSLSPALAQICLDYLNFDRLARAPIARQLRGGEQWILQCIARYRL